MDDGLYILWRKTIPQTPKAAQILTLPAYNQVHDIGHYDIDDYHPDIWGEFYPNYLMRWGRLYPHWIAGDPLDAEHVVMGDSYFYNWSDFPKWYFVQDCDYTGIMTELNTWGSTGSECRFFYPSPGPSSGTITKVSIWAEIQGSGKTLIRHSGTNYYGALNDGEIAMGWIHTDYATRPWGGSWAWSDLASGTLNAGVWMEMGYTVQSHGQTWKAMKYFMDSSLCKKIKIIIEWTLDGVPQTPITIWPNADDTSSPGYGPSQWCGNLLLLDPDIVMPWEEEGEYPVTIWGVIPGYVVSTLKTVPPSGSTINQLKLYYDVSSRDYWGQQTVTPFLQIGGVKYYGTERTLPVQSSSYDPSAPDIYSNSHTWTTNPATSQAWAYNDLAGVTYGLEFKKYATPPHNVLEYFVYNWDMEIKYDTTLYTHNYHGDLSSNHTIGAILTYPHMGAWRKYAGSRVWASNLAELPPKNSIVNSLKIDYKFYGFTEIDDTHHTVKPFIYYNGNYYYGTAVYLGRDPLELHEYDFTWTTNPATGLAWTREDLHGMRFGIEFTTDSSRAAWIWPTYLTFHIDHSPDAFKDIVEYQKIDGIVLFAKKVTQTPITPNELHFASKSLFSDRVELVSILNGKMDFHGLIWSMHLLSDDYIYTAYSQQILLNYRYLPTINTNYIIRTNWDAPGFAKPFKTLAEFLSDDCPINTFSQNPAALATPWQDDRDNPEGLLPLSLINRYYQTNDCNAGMGLLFLLNSLMLIKGDGTTAINVDPRVIDKQLFSTNHNSSLFAWDFLGGVCALSPVTGAPGDMEYHYDEADGTLTTHDDPNSLVLAADHLYDTFIRPGSLELANNFIAIQTICGGSGAEILNSILTTIGQEVQFRNDLDGLVYMDVAAEISRGTPTDPIKKYEHGINCKVEFIVPPDPPSRAVIGKASLGSKPILSTDWALRRPFFEKMVAFGDANFSQDLETSADIIFADNTNSFKIHLPYIDGLIGPGDWIWVKAENRGYDAVRIIDITIANGQTEISAGNIKKVSPISGWVDSIQWKQRKTTEIWHTMAGPKTVTFLKWSWLAKSADFDFTGPTGTSTFIITADDAKDDNLGVKLELSWSLWHGSAIETGVINGPNTGTAVLTASGETPTGVYEILCTVGDGMAMNWYKWRFNGGDWSAATMAYDYYYSPYFTIPDGKGIILRVDNMYHARVDDSWSIAQYPIEYATRMDMFLILKLNGKIIPPGRIKADGNSGSVELDLTEYCDKSTSVDTTNTLEAILVYGFPASTTEFCHKLSGSIKQFIRTKMVMPPE